MNALDIDADSHGLGPDRHHGRRVHGPPASMGSPPGSATRHGRRRRHHPCRRHRLPGPQARADDRRRARGRGGHRRRRGGRGRRGHRARSLLGDPRRRGQLRRRHPPAAAAARDLGDRRRDADAAGDRRGDQRLRRSRGGGAGGALDDRQRDAGSADAVHPRGAARQADHDGADGLRRAVPTAGEQAIAPFRALADPLADMVRPMRYPELYEGPEPEARVRAGDNLFVDRSTPAAAEAILEQLPVHGDDEGRPAPRARRRDGARPQRRHGVRPSRRAKLFVNVAAMYGTPPRRADAQRLGRRPGEALSARTAPAATSASSARRGRRRSARAYPGATWDRLRELKRRYDPDNLFRLNHNIPPGRGVTDVDPGEVRCSLSGDVLTEGDRPRGPLRGQR